MLKLLGASPGAGILVGIALLGFGLLTGRAVLAVAGGFVLVASALQWMNRPPGGQKRGDQSLVGRRR
jgi:membrane protein implicated in regulation of membrane protease activity